MRLTVTSSKAATNLVVKGKSRKKIQPLVVKNVNRKKKSLSRICHFESVEISCKTVMCLASGFHTTTGGYTFCTGIHKESS